MSKSGCNIFRVGYRIGETKRLPLPRIRSCINIKPYGFWILSTTNMIGCPHPPRDRASEHHIFISLAIHLESHAGQDHVPSIHRYLRVL